MINQWRTSIAFVALCMPPSYTVVTDATPMKARVHALVDALTREDDEQNAIAKLVLLGPEAVPYLVGELNDFRKLPAESIQIQAHGVDSFEAARFYRPQVVHDVVAAILNQITGIGFEFVYNGADGVRRSRNLKQWQDWCVSAYPDKIKTCKP